MKQNMKRVLLVLCMVTCLFSLSACSAKTDGAEKKALDPQTEAYLTQSAESLLQEITGMDEASAGMMEEALLEQGETGLASGLTSWKGVIKDTGSFMNIISSESEKTGHNEYSSTVIAQFENRQAEFKIFYEMNPQYQAPMPTSISFTPEYTTGEKMAKAAMNTLMGMGTVFLVLIFISLLIGCFKYINAFEKNMKNKTAAPAPAPAVSAPAPVVAPVVEEELVDDLELVAVITAAIAASTGSSTDGLVVRSIKRASGATWKRA